MTYNLQANTSNGPIDTTMDNATLNLHSHAASAPLLSPPSLMLIDLPAIATSNYLHPILQHGGLAAVL